MTAVSICQVTMLILLWRGAGWLAILTQILLTGSVMEQVASETMDQIIANSANSSQDFAFFSQDFLGMIRVEYDIVYSTQEWAHIQAINSSGSSGKRRRAAGVIADVQGQRWTNNLVPYSLASGTFSSSDQFQIREALNDWAKYTCLTFRPTYNNDRNRITFQNGGGCFSRVGMVGGSQVIGLAPICRQKKVIIHEVGHALGLHHEQTRPDRDQYVRVVKENIPPQMYYNFEKYTWRVIQNMGIPYDYTSIMHYGSRAFSTNGYATIETMDRQYQDVIGNAEGLSFRDIKTVNIMYNCKRARAGCTMNDNDCPGEGFVGKDCQCWCPGRPYTLCTGAGGGGSEGAGRGGNGAACRDQHSNCRYWADIGECNKNAAYMRNFCQHSCNSCHGGEEGPSCMDLQDTCQAWTRNGYCSGLYRNYMSTNCPRSCNFCDAGLDRERM